MPDNMFYEYKDFGKSTTGNAIYSTTTINPWIDAGYSYMPIRSSFQPADKVAWSTNADADNKYPPKKDTIKIGEAKDIEDDSDESIAGLVVMYPNLTGISEDKSNEYLQSIIKDNASLLQVYNDSNFAVIWLPHRTKESSHFEIWPLDMAKSKEIRIKVDVPFVKGMGAMETEGYKSHCCSIFMSEFNEVYALIIEQLKNQKFKISCVASSNKPTRIVIN